DRIGWPAAKELEVYFLTTTGQRSGFASGNDCWGLSLEGVDGTEHLQPNKGRIDIHLTIVGNVDHGVLLQYRKWGGGLKQTFYSRGDLRRVKNWVKTKDGDLMPIGLFIPFPLAWKAVEEFMGHEGALPMNISWIADRDIPEDAFSGPVADDALEI